MSGIRTRDARTLGVYITNIGLPRTVERVSSKLFFWRENLNWKKNPVEMVFYVILSVIYVEDKEWRGNITRSDPDLPFGLSLLVSESGSSYNEIDTVPFLVIFASLLTLK
jgi:hypothetical protein